jgi:hypothetical protein
MGERAGLVGARKLSTSKNGGTKSMPDGVPCVGTCEGEQRLGLGFYSLEWSCQNGRRDLVNAGRGLE